MASTAEPSMFPTFENPNAERAHRKERLAIALRLFGAFGFDEGVAGHITVRDPIEPHTFWVNPLGKNFKLMRVSDLIRIDHAGNTVEGTGLLNLAAFTIHSAIHAARPEVVGAAHAHSVYGKAFSSLGQTLLPITQDACAFFEDHTCFRHYTGVVNDPEEGKLLAAQLGSNKAMILQNHGLLTVGESVDEAAWWFITMERSCQAQLLAQAAGEPQVIPSEIAALTAGQVGSSIAGWFSFQPLADWMLETHPELSE